MARPRFVIGVDLGTTNTAVAYADTRSAEMRVTPFEVPQLVAPGALDRRPQLPSFLYLAGEHDLAPAETALPWQAQPPTGQRLVVGELGRSQGARMPSRMVASAKSWLCHPGVDRHAAILPWGVQDGPKLSPLGSSAAVLAHVKDAWDHVHEGAPGTRFVEQEVVVTVPASFDEAARELTLQAAAQAGLPAVVLLEEPQAAFYAWMNVHAGGRQLRPGERVLVFDVGGGTTDFTVIAVSADGRAFERTAVGEHLLLGGDNVDLTLAKVLEARIAARPDGRKLDMMEWHGLVHACRLAKESLLGNPDVAGLPVTVSGRGAKLIGRTLKEELTRAELESILHDGFFPAVAKGELPRRSRGGLQEMGLPYAADPAITRHLSAFLGRHGVERVDAVLFNGGAMAPASLRQRVLDQLATWQGDPPRELATPAPALAVAEGAAHYGLVRRGLGTRIGGGTPRAFYVGVDQREGRDRVVCLAQRGLVEGTTVELRRDFALSTNRPVSFKLYSSSTRNDQPGVALDLVPAGSPAGAGAATIAAAGGDDDTAELALLPPIVTVLRAPGRTEVSVHLEVRVTELGSLEIWCREPGATAASWRLSFDMRAGGAKVTNVTRPPAAEDAAPLDARVDMAKALIKAAFAAPGSSPEALAQLQKRLEETLGARRDEWPTATARALFDAVFAEEEARKRSAEHEARWLNLTGFCLRPGTGAPLDDWRTKEMWRIFGGDLAHPRAEPCRLAWWIAFRRISGGLGKGQQHQIYLRLAQLFLPGAKGRKKWDEVKPSPEVAAEMLRCLGNLERLSPEAKLPLGDELVRRLESKKVREDRLTVWTLARLGGRAPLYGPLNCVVPAPTASAWLAAILGYTWGAPLDIALSVAQLARRTGDRSRDLDDGLRARAVAWLKAAGAERAAVLVSEVVALEGREEIIALGDTLPPGLRLVGEAATS
jgi:molecular chaperone DnaK (HSP70)